MTKFKYHIDFNRMICYPDRHDFSLAIQSGEIFQPNRDNRRGLIDSDILKEKSLPKDQTFIKNAQYIL